MNDNILDLKEFLDRVQNDKELLLELFDIYIEDYAIKRKSLAEAIAKNDFEQVRNIAHSLKGASGNISAKNLREIFYKLEEMGKKGEIADSASLLSQVDEQFNLLEKRIQEVRAQYKA